MPLDVTRLEALFRDPRVPWAANLSNSGDRVILVAEWLRFADERLPGEVLDEDLKRATDAFVTSIGGEKLEVQGVRQFFGGVAGRLVGRERPGVEWGYSLPARFFGFESFGVADQFETARRAREPANE